MREFEDERDLVETFVVAYPNTDLDWPVDMPGHTVERTPQQKFFIRFVVSRVPDSRLIGKDGDLKRYRNYGSVLMQIVGPNGVGTGEFLEAAGKLSEIFRSKRKGGILSRTPSTGPFNEEGSTASVTVSVPYTSDFKVDQQGNILP